MSCKVRAHEHDHTFNLRCGFHDAWNAPGVALDPAGVGRRVQHSRDTRNLMQHGSAAATVDGEHCADAILDAVEVIETCWPGSVSGGLRPWVSCALRIVRLYSEHGDPRLRTPFEDALREKQWVMERKRAARNEVSIRLGDRDTWYLALISSSVLVEEALDAAGIP